jgi:replicative DNA helicase
MLLDPQVIPRVRSEVTREDFYLEKHATIFEAMGQVAAKSDGQNDLVLLNEILRTNGTLDTIGGGDYLVKLSESVPSSTNWSYYARIVSGKAVARRMIAMLDGAVSRCYSTDESKISEVATETSAALAGIALKTRAAPTVTMKTVLDGVYADLENRVVSQYRTGLEQFDRDFGGLPLTGVVVVTGINGSGKSSLANQFGLKLAADGHEGRIHSYEMGERAAVTMASAESRVQILSHIRGNTQPSDQEWLKLEQLLASDTVSKIHFSTRSMTASQIYAQASADAMSGHKWVVVDYIQNIARHGGSDNDAAAIAESAITLQRIAREFKMLVIAVSQMTLQSKREKRPPQPADCVGSGTIFDVADMMIGVFRPCLWERPDDFEGQGDWETRKRFATAHVLKNKYGKLGQTQLQYVGGLFRFDDDVTRRFS